MKSTTTGVRLVDRLRDINEPNALIVRRQAADEIERLRERLPRDLGLGATPSARLVLEIEVPGFYIEGNEAEVLAEEWGGTLLEVVTHEWMRSDVGLTFVSIPGEKNLSSDFEVHAMNGRIVGARIVKEAESSG